MDHQDHKTVIIGRTRPAGATRPQSAGPRRTMTAAQCVEAREEKGEKLKTVGRDRGRKILDGRRAKKMTQDQLGAKACVAKKTVQTYENGTAVYDDAVFNKLKRALGLR